MVDDFWEMRDDRGRKRASCGRQRDRQLKRERERYAMIRRSVELGAVLPCDNNNNNNTTYHHLLHPNTPQTAHPPSYCLFYTAHATKYMTIATGAAPTRSTRWSTCLSRSVGQYEIPGLPRTVRCIGGCLSARTKRYPKCAPNISCCRDDFTGDPKTAQPLDFGHRLR